MAALACWILTVPLGGCAAYQFGNATLYPTGIRTIHVPVVRNDTFRPDLGVRLTEALVKEIEARTPYKVVADRGADSILQCRVINESKRVLTETVTDDPRALDTAISVRASWISRSGQELLQNGVAPTGELSIEFSQDSRFVPEAGQSIDTANEAVIAKLANRIVSQMELRW